MNNFINVRMTSHNNLKIFSNIQHNCRYRKSLSEVSEMKNKLIDVNFGQYLQNIQMLLKIKALLNFYIIHFRSNIKKIEKNIINYIKNIDIIDK